MFEAHRADFSAADGLSSDGVLGPKRKILVYLVEKAAGRYRGMLVRTMHPSANTRPMRDRFNKLMLLFRTLVWLKPVQIWWRIWLKVRRPRPRTVPDVTFERTQVRWRPVDMPGSMTGPATFNFLNRTHTLRGAVDWNAPDLPKLWLYNLHYFDDLMARDAPDRADWHRDLILRWIAENPAGTGNGWEPYPTSLRIVNWIKWLQAGNQAPHGMLASLARQADWLSRRLEYHLLGNHLFANAKALMFAGACFRGDAADRWLATGNKILDREICEQILQDGGHFECSIMYHAIITTDVLDLVQLARTTTERIEKTQLDAWSATCERMMSFLQMMTHPDGRISFFNDGAFGIAPEPDALITYAGELGIAAHGAPDPLQRSKQSGYARLSTGPAVLFADVAPIGPDYLPGHAHADTLAFELSLDRQRIFVNGGTSVYGGNPRQRSTERSTRYHNTLEVDGENSSEIWAEFRVARRARPLNVSAEIEHQNVVLTGTHDGYRRFGGPLHTRRWELSAGRLSIEDRLDRPARSAIARFRLHPDLSATPTLISGARPIRIRSEGGALTVEDGTWSPEFGKVVPCKVLTLTLDGQHSRIEFSWEP